MKLFTLFFALVISTNLTFSQQEKTTKIKVTIDNVLNDSGVVLFSLHTKDTFMKGNGIQSAKSKIEEGKVSITFKNVIPGEYAILVLHDENQNNRMDFEDNGMPLESYGISNNPRSYGPPEYHTAKFKVTDQPIEMNIRF